MMGVYEALNSILNGQGERVPSDIRADLTMCGLMRTITNTFTGHTFLTLTGAGVSFLNATSEATADVELADLCGQLPNYTFTFHVHQ
jgi:hypothetical protein